MNNKLNFIFIIIIILIFLITFETENFQLETNKYSVILVNHNKYHIIVVKNANNIQDQIYKIYKN